MDAEKQKAESGAEHQNKAIIFNAAELKVRIKYTICHLFIISFGIIRRNNYFLIVLPRTHIVISYMNAIHVICSIPA